MSSPHSGLPARTYKLSPAEREGLPDIGRFLVEPSRQFPIDWHYLGRGSPYLGLNAARPHTGAHVYFRYPEKALDPQQPQSYPPIYAVADGIVTRIDEAFRLQPVYFPWLGKSVANVRYGIDLALFDADVATRFHATWEEQRLRGDWPLPPCFGFRLDAKENPFGTGPKDTL